MSEQAVLLLDFGGPNSLADVRPFLQNLFSDPVILPVPSFLRKPLAWWIAKKRAPYVCKQYAQIGGRSPLPEQTRAFATQLQFTLQAQGMHFPVYYGMRYWHPLISETCQKIVADGVTELIIIPLFPQFSYATTESVFKEFGRAACSTQRSVKINHWYQHPKFIQVWVETIREGLKKFANPAGAHLFFSAHSLPVKWVIEKYNDPYPAQIQESVAAIVKALDWKGPWHLGFQSKIGPVKWLGPATIDLTKELAKSGMQKALFIPISFVSDHVETLFELEKLVIPEAKPFGLEEAHLTAPIIKHPLFMELIVDLVKTHAV